ncbi:MAG: YcdB/YcdC domain-containing protein [Candidatus Thorarchaeota archaeon]
MKKVHTLWIVGLLAFVFLFSAPTSMATMSFTQQESPVIHTATSLVSIPDSAVLESEGYIQDSYWDKTLWSVSWITSSHDLIAVQFDQTGSDLLYYVDGSKTWIENDCSHPRESMDKAWLTSLTFLKSMETKGQDLIPSEAEFMGGKETTQGWQFEWIHKHNDAVVKDNYVRIGVDHSGTEVFLFAKNWNDIGSLEVPKDTSIESMTDQMNEDGITINSAELCITVIEDVARYAWIVSTDVAEIWIDANTKSILKVDELLLYQDVFPVDGDWGTSGGWSKYTPTYDCAQSIDWRLDTGTTEGGRYFPDCHASTVENYLDDDNEKVFFFIGHGEDYGSATRLLFKGTGVSDPYSYLENGDIPTLNNMKLAFLCACWSMATDYNSIGETFVSKGADCVFGWYRPVSKTPAMSFSKYFFDYAVNSYTFASCYSYAYGKVDSATQSIARMDGSSSGYLTQDDLGDSSGTAYNMGNIAYVGDDDYYFNDEGLWGPDQDWIKFSMLYIIEGQIKIWITPTHGLDAEFYLYNSNMQIVSHVVKTGGGVGVQEYGCWEMGPGTYYVKIYHPSGNVHGGSFDMKLSYHVLLS